MRHSPRAYLSLLAMGGALAVSTWAPRAAAADCTSDADCEAGYECIKGMSSPGCDSSGECPEPTPVEEEVGSCELAPVECSTSDDCPEYLTCADSQELSCWSDSNGNTGCEEPDPNAPKYCSFREMTCATNDDCPREFECVEHESYGCPAVDCVEGEECNDTCEPTLEKECQPKKIDCSGGAACPSGWSCITVTTGSDCAEPAPAPGGTTDPDAPADSGTAPDGGCESFAPTSESFCAPDILVEHGYASDSGGSAENDAGGDSTSGGAPKPEEPKSPGGKATDDGGCSVAPVLGGSSSIFAPLMLLVPFAARLRRRRAS